MAKREIIIEYEFISTSANGDSYFRTRAIKAENEQVALNIAGIIGFSEFGARFTENCVDWRVKR